MVDVVHHNFNLDFLHIRMVKGNELASLITESFGAGMFQETMADGRDRNKAISVSQKVAALGVRGDYIEIVANISRSEVSAPADDTIGLPMPGNALMIDVVDVTGVPLNVQHGIYGRYSPFDTPNTPVTFEDTVGIDVQFLTIVPCNVFRFADINAMNIPKPQMVRGELDDRFTIYCNKPRVADVTELIMRIKPNADGVLLIQNGALIWGRPNKEKVAREYFGFVKGA